MQCLPVRFLWAAGPEAQGAGHSLLNEHLTCITRHTERVVERPNVGVPGGSLRMGRSGTGVARSSIRLACLHDEHAGRACWEGPVRPSRPS